MKTIQRTFYYPTFDPNTNSFDFEEYTHERHMTKKERKWHRAHSIFWWVGMLTFIVFFILTAILMGNGQRSPIGWVSLGIMCGSLLVMATIGRIITTKYERVMDWAQEIGFDDEILRWEQITQEQNDIAEEWRKDHPLEEAIRKAQASKNCNDIATLARLYAQELKG